MRGTRLALVDHPRGASPSLTLRWRLPQKPKLPRIAPHQAIDAVRGDRIFQSAGAVVADRPEQRAAVVEGHPDLAARAGALDSRFRGNDTTLKDLI